MGVCIGSTGICERRKGSQGCFAAVSSTIDCPGCSCNNVAGGITFSWDAHYRYKYHYDHGYTSGAPCFSCIHSTVWP